MYVFPFFISTISPQTPTIRLRKHRGLSLLWESCFAVVWKTIMSPLCKLFLFPYSRIAVNEEPVITVSSILWLGTYPTQNTPLNRMIEIQKTASGSFKNSYIFRIILFINHGKEFLNFNRRGIARSHPF